MRPFLCTLILLLAPTLLHAGDWTRASELPGTHAASAAEIKLFRHKLGGTLMKDYIERGSHVLVHDGDLRIDGNFDNDAILVVRGNLDVTGMFDDYRADIGIVVVFGDMRVRDAYSWGAMYVQGDLHATGLVMTVYNDFTFEIGGAVHARGLVVSDKSASYKRGTLGFVLDDMGSSSEDDVANALRQLEPALFTAPGHLDLYSGELDELQPDHEAARERLADGGTVFRASPAPTELTTWALQAIAETSDDTTLTALIGRDPLIDQLLASRTDLDSTIARRLAERGDPIVLAWLAQTAPHAVPARDTTDAPQNP